MKGRDPMDSTCQFKSAWTWETNRSLCSSSFVLTFNPGVLIWPSANLLIGEAQSSCCNCRNFSLSQLLPLSDEVFDSELHLIQRPLKHSSRVCGCAKTPRESTGASSTPHLHCLAQKHQFRKQDHFEPYHHSNSDQTNDNDKILSRIDLLAPHSYLYTVMAHHRSLAYHPTARTYSGADDRDYSPPDDDSKSGRGEKKPRKRNSVAVCASRSLLNMHWREAKLICE